MGISALFAQSWVKALISASMVIGPTLGFALQYREIQRTLHVRGFSTWICFLLLMANIFRIYYWILERFDTTLLLQSIAMICTQLALLEICIRLKHAHPHITSLDDDPIPIHREPRRLADGWRYIWRWSYFSDYLQFLLFIIFLISGIVYVCAVLLEWSALASIIGTIAVSFEAIFAVPQVIRLYMQRSAAGVRWEMVATWIIGDILKTAYYFYKGVPVQFVVCGIFQMTVDTIVGIQVIYYTITRPRTTLKNETMTEFF